MSPNRSKVRETNERKNEKNWRTQTKFDQPNGKKMSTGQIAAKLLARGISSLEFSWTPHMLILFYARSYEIFQLEFMWIEVILVYILRHFLRWHFSFVSLSVVVEALFFMAFDLLCKLKEKKIFLNCFCSLNFGCSFFGRSDCSHRLPFP